ncbi:MAG: NIL domain-containing protein, partial [Candidatus Bathyarchaeota archaeon]
MDRILLRFSEENVAEPITSQVILELGIPMRIVTATVNSSGGDILLEVPAIHVEKIVKAFREKDVIVRFPKLIEVDCDKCFD